MDAGDEAFTLGMRPEKGVSKCAGRPLLGNILSRRPFHQMSKYSALRVPSHNRRKGIGRKVELKSQTRRILYQEERGSRNIKSTVTCLICFCSLGGVLELQNGQCVKPYVYYHNWKGVYWNPYIAVIRTAFRHAQCLFSVRFPLRFSRI